jgi:hypothetical protein
MNNKANTPFTTQENTYANVTYGKYERGELPPQDLERLYLENPAMLEQWMSWKRQALELKAKEIVAATLTEDWRRLIGPAAQLVETLMLERLTAELETGSTTTGHVFATQDALAARVGVTARTLRNWLSDRYSGREWLLCWIDRRTWYMTREDGNRSRGGTIWRVSVEARGCSDRTRAPKVSYDALRTPWRTADELPGARASSAIEAVLDYKGSSIAPQENVPKRTGMALIQVEGRHRSLFHAPFSRSGFHTGNHSPGISPTPARAQFAQAWEKAQIVASKLGDVHSKGYWFKQFRALEIAGRGDAAVWAAVGQGLEARAAGRLTRGTAAGYAVGVLQRSGASA